MGKTHTEDERVYHEEMPKADTGFLDVTGRPICVSEIWLHSIRQIIKALKLDSS